MGSLEVLNVGKGDITIQYDTDNEPEAMRARRVIEDMLQRGYALMILENGKYTPVKRFNKKKGTYVIADGPLYAGDQNEPETPQTKVKKKAKGRRGRTREVPVSKAKAVGVARTAGG